MPLSLFSKMGNSRSAPSTPVIATRDGKIQGKRLVDEPNFKADAYLGIPFAQPPLGDLRFRKPVAPNKWADTRECFEHPKKCIQVPFELLSQNDKDWPASEDCLYLNLFCPGDYTLKGQFLIILRLLSVWFPWLSHDNYNKYPVMLFIHGGGYACGSVKAYGEQGICDGLVRQGVVVVTIQYRLGIFGFFSTGDEVCPGNLGLWDQIEALKWVKDNIEHFGGDKARIYFLIISLSTYDNVTILGQSAGGASVDLLSLSPHTKGLIHRVIPMAGNAHAPWAHRKTTADYCREYAETKLGIKADSSSELISQLRRVSADRLATELHMETALAETFLGFCPVIDGDLLPRPVEELRKVAPVLPVMAGVTSLECGLFIPNKDLTEENIKKMAEAMLPDSAIKESTDALVKMYREVALRKQPKNELWRAMVEIAGDRMFNISTVETLKKCSQRGAATYFYVFDYYNPKCLGPFSEMAPSSDASHCSELAYVFNAGVAAPFAFCDHDKQMADMTMKAFANFAKRGNPNDEGEKCWLPFDFEHPGRHMVIDLKPRMEEEYLGGRCTRWMELQKHE
ncbi:hypothetical protein PRIPAC_95839 [Pristionchus pacificus]|uniref:Hydrolase n=1 Tax=Pristionchus pacificus TaxID=54126 RepID=A0A2A6B2X5_PRIPA|nr:hypothetical protein PRIPAC_95839 [Pristionchus pacificus]|eukprot:PDM60222.1 hydrolase [Pristionchus pacificus]